jgi:hypothetical protein
MKADLRISVKGPCGEIVDANHVALRPLPETSGVVVPAAKITTGADILDPSRAYAKGLTMFTTINYFTVRRVRLFCQRDSSDWLLS